MSEPFWEALSPAVGLPLAAAPSPAARVFHNAPQSIPNGVWTPLTFNSERFDTDNMHDPASNPSRLTCRTAGRYLIFAHVVFDASASGTARQVSLRLNGTGSGSPTPSLGGDQTPAMAYGKATVATAYDLAVGDYVEVVAYHDAGAALNVVVSSNDSPEFGMVRFADVGGVSAISPTLLDAKGDLIVASANDIAARLGVGADGQVLTADAAAPSGVKWAPTMITGVVSSTGAVQAGSGFTASRQSTGRYTVNFNTPFPAAPTVILAVGAVTGNEDITLNLPGAGVFQVNINEGGLVVDRTFCFIAVRTF